ESYRISHWLPGLPPRGAGIRESVNELRQLYLRSGDPGAAGRYQDADYRSAGAHQVLQTGIVSFFPPELHLWHFDSVATRAIPSAPERHRLPAALPEPGAALQ